MSDYEYTPMNQQEMYTIMSAHIDRRLSAAKRKAALTVEVTRRYVTFIRPHTSTSYEVSRPSYDRLAALANSGEYVVEILPSSMGIAWTMRRKGA